MRKAIGGEAEADGGVTVLPSVPAVAKFVKRVRKAQIAAIERQALVEVAQPSVCYHVPEVVAAAPDFLVPHGSHDAFEVVGFVFCKACVSVSDGSSTGRLEANADGGLKSRIQDLQRG